MDPLVQRACCRSFDNADRRTVLKGSLPAVELSAPDNGRQQYTNRLCSSTSCGGRQPGLLQSGDRPEYDVVWSMVKKIQTAIGARHC